MWVVKGGGLLSKPTKIIIGILVFFIIAGVSYQWGFLPLYAKITDTNQQIKAKQNELNLIKAKVNSIPELEKALKAAGIEPGKLSKENSVKRRITEISRQINFLAKRCNLKVERLVAAQDYQPYEKNQQYKYLSLQLEGTGSFKQVTDFFDSLTRSDLLLEVDKYNIASIQKSKKTLLKYQITINAFEI